MGLDRMLSTNPRADPEERRSASSASGLLAGRFEIVREIGHGSTGALLVASEGGVTVAIKRASDRALLRHEADVLADLAHPGIVRLKERHEDGNPPFLLLELVEGQDLEAVLAGRGGTLDSVTLARLLLQLCDIVGFVHDRGFLHRDLKPANVLIRADGSPVLIDFGAAARVQVDGGNLWSFVTEGFGAPEQYFADQREGPWTDIYGLGALACRALTGAPPPAALIRASGARGEPLAVPGAPALGLRQAIDWALEPEAADRPQSIGAWRERLKDALAQAQAEIAPPATPAAGTSAASALDDYPPTVRVERARVGVGTRIAEPPPAPPPRRRRVPVALLILAAVVVAGAIGAGIYGWPLYERYLKSEWRVEQAGGGDTLTIADALLRARDGALITIGPGTYRESLRIDRPVQLVAGEGAAPVVAPASGPCAQVTSAAGSIVGLAWQAASGTEGEAGACLVLARGAVTLEDNQISGEEGAGIVIRDGADPVVRGNRLERVGMVVTAGGRGTITANSIVDVAGTSLMVRGGADPSLSDNEIEGGGVVFAEGAAGSLVGNRVLGAKASGIRVVGGAVPRVIDNTIEGAGEAGIFVYDSGGGRFENNTIAGNGLSGVVIAGGGRPELAGNRIRDNAEHGVLVLEGGRALVEGNEIVANKGHGIALAVGSEVEMSDNRLEGNDEPQLVDGR